MTDPDSRREDRSDVLDHLRYGVGRSLQLARRLAEDPLVGGEARSLLSRLHAIEAEVEIMARSQPRRRRHDNDSGWDGMTRLWQ